MLRRNVRRIVQSGLLLLLPAISAAQGAKPDYSRIELRMIQPILEGNKDANGQLLNIQAGTSLHMIVGTAREGKTEPEAQLLLSSSSGTPATLNQVDIDKSSGAFSLHFGAPIAAGQTLWLILVRDDASEVRRFGPLTFPAEISIPNVSLKVQEPVTVGSTKISGKISAMPNPAVPPVAAAGGNPATFGNYPGVVVWWNDPLTCSPAPKKCDWSLAAPTVGANPPQFLSVNSDGGFEVTLPSALKAGQKIRVDVVAPPGRTIKEAQSLAPPPSELPPGYMASQEADVITDASLLKPTNSTTPFNEGTTVITGNATPPSSGVPISIALLRLKETDNSEPPGMSKCLRADRLDPGVAGVLLPLTSSASNTFVGTLDAATGAFKVTLAKALKEGEWVQIVQVVPAGSVLPPEEEMNSCASKPMRVKYPFEFYRTNLTFVAGVLLSNSSASNSTNANFSQANQFYAFNADHAWALPGADYICGNRWGQFTRRQQCNERSNAWQADKMPGISTFFEGRLTSIPVSTASATTPATNQTAGAFVASTGSTTTQGTSTLLTSQKVFRVETGAFFPWLLRHGPGEHPGALFLAPLAKAGFDTLTGATSVNNVILPGNTTGPLDFQSAYNFFVFGGRVGNMALSKSSSRAPQIEHFLDVTIGRYSNLQSFICHPVPPKGKSNAANGTSCVADYPAIFSSTTKVEDSRKQLYRLDFEGLVKIPLPATQIPFYIGFNANIAQHTVGALRLDHGYASPDDIRILLGTKFDIGTLLSSLNLGTH